MTKYLTDCFPLYDVVCSLMEKRFSTWEEKDMIDVVKVDRPKVTLTANKRSSDGSLKKFKRYFYLKYDWICGSTYFQNFHCWPCLLFAEKSDRWASDLIYDENDLDMFEEHAKQESHIACEIKLAEFKVLKCTKESDMGKSLLEDVPKQILSSEDMTASYEIQMNRQCAQLAVDAILFMVKKQMSLGQKDESSPCSYADLFHLLLSQNQDEEIKNHFWRMRGCVNPILTQSMLQGVIESVSECILEQLQIIVKAVEFFSLRIDDGLDESSDCAFFIRIVNPNNDIKEFFIGSYSLGNDKTSLSLFKILDSVLEKFEYKSKLIGICFDITCVKFNYLKDLCVGMKFMAQQSTNVNLFGHCLDYMVEKCLNRIPTCCQFFADLSELLNLTKVLVERNHRLNSDDWREVCSMKNSCRSKFKLLSVMLQDWIGMFKFFQEVQTETVNLKGTLCLLSWISGKLIDPQFVFLAVFLCELFEMTNTLYQELIDNSFDPLFCHERVKQLCVTLYRKRNDSCYEAIYKKAEQFLSECSGAEDKTPSTVADSCYKSLYHEILDNLIMELHTRFETTDQHTYFEIGNLFQYDAKDLYIQDKLRAAQNSFPNIIKETKELKTQLLRLHYVHRKSKKLLLNLIYEQKSKCVKQNTFAHAYKLMSLITLLTPSTEKFSCLHEFSNYLNVSDISLRPYLANILMNKDILDALSIRYSFKDDILNKLSVKYDAIKLSHMVKSLEKRPEIVERYKINLTKLNPTTFMTSAPGPSTQMEPDSSMVDQDVHLAMTCDIYPAEEPPSETLINIKKEPVDPDKQDILSASVMQELRHFSNEPSSTSNLGSSLFQPPLLIKEEPIFSEDES